MTEREPEWCDESRAEVFAYLDYEAQSCHGCGGYLPDTTDPTGRWVASDPSKCFKCEALRTKQSAYSDVKHPDAFVIWPVERSD